MKYLLVTPVLNSITPFPADSPFTFTFEIFSQGDQVIANTLVIEKISDGSEIYNQKITTFSFEHELPANTLVNGEQYRAKIQTHDIDNNSSEFSESILFYCFSTPEITIDNLTGIINNSSFEFQGNYYQSEGEELESYRFYLYDSNSVLLAASTEKFGEPIIHTFSNLQDDGHYQVEIRVYTTNSITATSGLIPFDVNYISPLFHSAIELENIDDQASIKINLHILNIEGKIEYGAPTYEDNEWINLKDSGIYFDDAFSIENNFTLKFWCKDITENENLIELLDSNGNVILIKYFDNKFHVYKITDNLTPYYVFSDDISFTSSDVICVQIQQINDLINIDCEVVV